MNERYQHNSSNGFLLGVIVGVLLTLLFVTKKGRRILKMLTDEGIDRIEDLEKVLKERMVDEEDDFLEDEIIGNDFVSHEPLPVPVVARPVVQVHHYETRPMQHHEVSQSHVPNHTTHEHQNNHESYQTNNHVHHEDVNPTSHHVNNHVQREHVLGGQQAIHRVKQSPRRFFKGVPKRN